MKKIPLIQALFLFACLALRYNVINAMKRSNNEINNYQEIVGPSTRFKGSLDNNMLRHTERKAYPCNKCNLSFASQSCLTRHQHIHGEVKLHSCTFCDKSYDSKNSFYQHMKRHKDLKDLTKGKQYLCTLCNKSYTSKSSLNQHMQKHRDRAEGKQYSCPLCDKSYTCKNGLAVHKSRYHKTTKNITLPLMQKMNYIPIERLPFEDGMQEYLSPSYLEWY